jgi:hypothetical protein
MGLQCGGAGLAGRENYKARRLRQSYSAFGCIVRFAIALALPHSLQRRRLTKAVIVRQV